MKTLQKGFSLVELLVVVAIIGVLAGVGIVGYQSYTDSAKERVSLANYNSVKRFVETELTLLNNNIQTVSGAINSFDTDCATSSVKYDSTLTTKTIVKFTNGLTCYFATDGYGNIFKNPYDPAGGSQVLYNQAVVANTSPAKGSINIAFLIAADATGGRSGIAAANITDGTGTPATVDHLAAAADKKGWFIIEYYTADGVRGTAGEKKGKMFELK
jgi:type IV pilus assembly protein PilA